nr:uncharacterized protein CTRU02_10620 [Colletotrichum truncatum]KAF6786921.1 hypothetical protein CTRU02_10620 [Colletotrichum truncatum]
MNPNGEHSNDSRQSLVIGFTITFIVIATVFIGIRLYLRRYLKKCWGLDGSIFLVSALLIMFQSANIIANEVYGSLGLHVWEASPEALKRDRQFFTAAVLLYQVSTTSIKATFLLQYRRAFALPFVKLFCDIALAFILIIMISMLLSGGLVMRMALLNSEDGSQGASIFLTWAYANASIHFLTDIIIFFFPIPIVGRLKLATIQKAGLVGSFAVGLFTCGVSIFRISTFQSSLDGIDSFYRGVPLSLLSIAEPTSALVCVCVPLLRPLLARSRSHAAVQQDCRPVADLPDVSAANGVSPLDTADLSRPASPITPRTDSTAVSYKAQIQ